MFWKILWRSLILFVSLLHLTSLAIVIDLEIGTLHTFLLLYNFGSWWLTEESAKN